MRDPKRHLQAFFGRMQLVHFVSQSRARSSRLVEFVDLIVTKRWISLFYLFRVRMKNLGPLTPVSFVEVPYKALVPYEWSEKTKKSNGSTNWDVLGRSSELEERHGQVVRA